MGVENNCSACAPAELPGLIAQLDAEFIFGRGRKHSLIHRFPALLTPSNHENIFVAREQGRIVSAIVVKLFQWITGDRRFSGAMLGMVWTDPQQRGRGHGTRLLEHVKNELRHRADFAVLWTSQPAFYERTGWIAGDCAVLGQTAGSGNTGSARPAVNFESLRAIWKCQPQRVEREAHWHLPLPVDAEAREVFAAGSAYAIAGRNGNTLYCYEWLGDDTEFGAILGNMRAGCATLRFNERAGSRACGWLSEHGVTWENKPLAMWLPLREQGILDTATDWYIPWLDRI